MANLELQFSKMFTQNQWEFQDPKMEVPPINRFLKWPLTEIVPNFFYLPSGKLT